MRRTTPGFGGRFTLERQGQREKVGRHTDKVAIVTGGASGIGAAIVHRLSAEGARVIVADIDEIRGELIASQTGAAFVRFDVSSANDWRALAGTLDRIDVVVNNAFATKTGPTHYLDSDAWQRTLDVTLTPVFHSVQACIDALRDTRGTIVNISSVHALMGFTGMAAYDAAKGGVCAVTRSLAVEYAPDVRVNAVLPGGIDTPGWGSVTEAEKAAFIHRVPAARLGRPEEIASVVSFLASVDASYITGASIVADGGYSIHNQP